MATLCALRLKGANRVIVIDNLQWRLDAAATLGAETLNFSECKDVPGEIRKRIPGGPNVCIECAGYRYSKSPTQKVQMNLKLETDTVDIVNEMIIACQKGGRLSLIGDYFGYTNNFPIGALMEKNLTSRGGQVFVQKYWKYLLNQIESGVIDPSFVFSHTYNLEDCPKAYKAFAQHDKGFIKPILLTKHNPRRT
jgi:threonine dehydrogenase-like Zn-dependent dehydrogenase